MDSTKSRRRGILTVALALALALPSCRSGPSGPATATPLRSSAPTSWTKFSGGSASRLAILLTDTTAPWLPLAHGLRTAGVPFTITRDYHEALTHRVVLIYPMASGSVLSPDALNALIAFPSSGGTLIGTNVLGGGLAHTFGFKDAVPSHTRQSITFSPSLIHHGGLDDPRESTLHAPAGTYGYTQPAEPPMAVFDDGTAAVTQRTLGTGHAYALGVDLGASGSGK